MADVPLRNIYWGVYPYSGAKNFLFNELKLAIRCNFLFYLCLAPESSQQRT